MSDWNAQQYLKFKAQRTQPAIDLASRIRNRQFQTAMDIGCGPGNSTAVLQSIFPDTKVEGMDSSENMIMQAKKQHPDISFRLCDVHDIEESYDLLFSNACLQWLPNHEILLPKLMDNVNPGGILAIQIPENQEEPLFKIIKEVAQFPQWDFHKVIFERNEVLNSHQYVDILSECASSFDLWETVYYHQMSSHSSLLEWVRGTRLRSYLDVLNQEQAALFEQEILNRVKQAYPISKNGTVILRFKRLFFIAER